MAVVAPDVGGSYCLIRGFQPLQTINMFDCPQLTLSRIVFSAPSSHVEKAVSIVHECGVTCKCIHKTVRSNVERETVTSSSTKLEFEHVFCGNSQFYLNIYCIHTT